MVHGGGSVVVGVVAGIPARRFVLRAGHRAPWAVASLGVALWCVVLRATPDSAYLIHVQAPAVARNLASGLFLVAGVLRLSRWRLTGDPAAARASLALLLLGVAVPAAALIGPILHESGAVAQNAPSARALFLIPVLTLLLPGRRWGRQTVARPIPASLTAWALVGTAGGLAVLGLIRVFAPGAALHEVVFAIATAAACGWLVLATRELRDVERPMHVWSATAAGLLAVAEVLRAWAASGAPTAVGLAPGVELAAVVVVVAVAATELRDAFHSDNANAHDLSRALARLQHHLAEVERVQRERLHDARTAVVGVMGASELLATPTPRPDADLLRRLLLDELHRLQAVLDPSGPEPIAPFDLAHALAPVLAVHQLDGPPLRVQLAAPQVLGRPRATATVLDNLLRNARIHAPRASVLVRAVVHEGTVTVLVEDDGPGIPAAECRQVLQPGVRGSAVRAPGEGLGLHSSDTAMRAQGGTLQLSPRRGGGTCAAFTLPHADIATSAPDVLAS